MRVEVRYFASLAELAGRASETLEVDADADVRTVWSLLTERHPALTGLSYRPLVACDMSYADWDTPVGGVREVAFLPPVSGG